jgi:hypothetical protein
MIPAHRHLVATPDRDRAGPHWNASGAPQVSAVDPQVEILAPQG